MTIKIEIEAHPDRGDMGIQIQQAMSALGYVREKQQIDVQMKWVSSENKAAAEAADKELHDKLDARAEQQTVSEPTAAVVAPRKRGEPSPGKARRTRAEIAEDEAADAAAALREFEVKGGTPMEEVAAELGISTGENRVGPDDTAEDAAQDAADEKAEQDAKRTGLTHDDLRHAVGRYQKKHGMPAAVALVQQGGLIGKPVIEVPEADLEGLIAKLDGEAVAEVSKVVEQASDKPADTPVTRDDLVALMMAYVEKYGREAADEDSPKIFTSALGPIPEGLITSSGKPATKWVLSVVPTDGESLAKAVKWWKSALTQAPKAFGRKAVA